MRSLSEIIGSALNETKKAIIANHIAAGQFTSGRTSGMLSVENVSMAGGQLFGWKWFQTWETGRGPTKNPTPCVPTLREAIASYMQTKYGLSPKEAMRAAYPVAQKIHRFGNSLYRKGGRKDIFTPPIEKLFSTLPGEIGTLLINQVIEWVGTKARPSF